MDKAFKLKKRNNFNESFEAKKMELAALLGDNIGLIRFRQVAMMAIMDNPALLQADEASVLKAIFACAKMQLLPDGHQAIIVSYFNRTLAKYVVSAQPMVGGLIEIFHRSGKVKTLEAQVVYKCDRFEWGTDINTETGTVLKHSRGSGIKNYDTMTHAYAFLKTLDGASFSEVMTKEEIDAVRACSEMHKQKKGKGVWFGAFWPEMVKKTVIRRLSKRAKLPTPQAEESVRAVDQINVMPQQIEAEEEAPKQVESKGVAALIEQEQEGGHAEG